jgi:hypothetical protein
MIVENRKWKVEGRESRGVSIELTLIYKKNDTRGCPKKVRTAFIVWL